MAASAAAQSLRGTVKDESGRPIELATVVLNNELWAATDKKGAFVIKNVPAGRYSYRVSYVGLQTTTGTITISTGNERLDVRMQSLNLKLESVTVTATQNKLGSTSTIGESAIRHIQPKSLADMLQLLPGNLTENPNLNNLAQAQIREIGKNSSNALGTSVVVDGTPLSNDANLQSLSPTMSGSRSGLYTDGMNDQTTAGRGSDLRTVSADNIESVEVIRGIPSVEYGNLTSGVVVVKTKTGVTPYEIKAKADPFSKMVFAGKGFGLQSGGAINMGVDYSQSYADTRKHYLGFERITATVGYSNQWRRTTFNAKGAVYSNINERKEDPQMSDLRQTFSNRNIGFRLSVNGIWKPDLSWLSSLDYNISAQSSWTTDKHSAETNNTTSYLLASRENGMTQVPFIVGTYTSKYQIKSQPLDIFAQLKANKYIPMGEKDYTSLKLGIEYKMSANYGEGLTFDFRTPPSSSGVQTLRPRSYSDIPALHSLSAFFEDRMAVTAWGMPIQMSAGVRVSNLMLNKEKSGQDHLFVVEPRINAAFTILDKRNNKFFDDLSLTGGFGISNKMPTLLYLYPDQAYYDNKSFAVYGDDDTKRLAVITTQVVKDTKNPKLKPANSRKWEVGLNFRIGKMNGFITYFNERHIDEFGFNGQLIWCDYNKYTVPTGANNLTFDGTNVTYNKDGTTQTAAVTRVTDFETWSKPSNTSRTDKHGIEYMFDLGTLRALRTSLNIDGAWFHIKRKSEMTGVTLLNNGVYDYAPVYAAGSGSVCDRINTNFRFITHIPALRLVLTSTVQVVWYESQYSIYEGADGKPRYTRMTDGSGMFNMAPVGFYDKQGGYTPWQPGMENDKRYQLMNQRFLSYAFDRDVYEPWVMLNIRLTKEIGNWGEISFTANNFPNMSRWHVNKNSKAKSQLYPSMYFGAELKLYFK